MNELKKSLLRELNELIDQFGAANIERQTGITKQELYRAKNNKSVTSDKLYDFIELIKANENKFDT
jgi:hypothetical protein